MGATGRKLTIRMPDNPRLRSAEVASIHLDPGARVQSGNPVLTLVNRRKEHLVRAPRSGRIVPLIAAGDRVSGGDPLYILHLDEAALDDENREQKALIAIEREKWTSGILADAIEPVARNKAPEPGFDFEQLVRDWGKPVLAVALYVLACFALLPILHLFGQTASMPVLIAMVAGCIAFAWLIYYLYAPDAGRWPKWTVRMVAISWVGISSIALFYRPDNPQDLTFETATGPIASLFAPSEAPLPPPPEPAPTPATLALATSGVAVGPVELIPQPEQSPPSSVLARFDQVPEPHRVTVREWARYNPDPASGNTLTFDQKDQAIPPRTSADPLVASATSSAAERTGDPVLSEWLATPPARAKREADIVMAAIPQVRDTALPDLRAVDHFDTQDAGTRSDAAFAVRESTSADLLTKNTLAASATETSAYAVGDVMSSAALAVLKGDLAAATERPTDLAAIQNTSGLFSDTAERLAMSAQPPDVKTPAPNLFSQYRIADSGWVEDQSTVRLETQEALIGGKARAEPAPQITASVAEPASVPTPSVPLGPDTATAPEARGQIAFGVASPTGTQPGEITPIALNLVSSGVSFTAQPVQLASARSPDLLLINALRAGEKTWMLDQTALLGAAPSQGKSDQRRFLAGQAPILTTANANPMAHEPRVSALQTQISNAKVFGMAVLPVLDGVQTAPKAITEADRDFQTASLAPVGTAIIPASLSDATDPQAIPVAPAVQPELQIAQRDLLYLYFDDPRILAHPQIGDPWEGLVSPQLAAAIERTEVVEVHEMLQVQNWCAAANDPSGTRQAELGTDYTKAFINDRIRLLRVRLSLDENSLDRLEAEIPLFDGTPAGFFHNKAPLLAGLPTDDLMQTGRDYLRSLSAGIFDPNAPDAIGGGQYFDNAIAVSVILQGAGCDQVSLNDGDGPANQIGRLLNQRLGG